METHQSGHWVGGAKPGLLKDRRSQRGAEHVVHVLGSSRSGRGRLNREVPVGEGELGINVLEAVLERVGQQAVTGQEPETVVELKQERQKASGRA